MFANQTKSHRQISKAGSTHHLELCYASLFRCLHQSPTIHQTFDVRHGRIPCLGPDTWRAHGPSSGLAGNQGGLETTQWSSILRNEWSQHCPGRTISITGIKPLTNLRNRLYRYCEYRVWAIELEQRICSGNSVMWWCFLGQEADSALSPLASPSRIVSSRDMALRVGIWV